MPSSLLPPSLYDQRDPFHVLILYGRGLTSRDHKALCLGPSLDLMDWQGSYSFQEGLGRQRIFDRHGGKSQLIQGIRKSIRTLPDRSFACTYFFSIEGGHTMHRLPTPDFSLIASPGRPIVPSTTSAIIKYSPPYPNIFNLPIFSFWLRPKARFRV